MLQYLPRLVWVCVSDCIVRYVHHAGVLDLVDGVGTNECDPTTLRDQHDVVSLKEPHKPCNAINKT